MRVVSTALCIGSGAHANGLSSQGWAGYLAEGCKTLRELERGVVHGRNSTADRRFTLALSCDNRVVVYESQPLRNFATHLACESTHPGRKCARAFRCRNERRSGRALQSALACSPRVTTTSGPASCTVAPSSLRRCHVAEHCVNKVRNGNYPDAPRLQWLAGRFARWTRRQRLVWQNAP